jgi:murein DD-endopeptidase MepM/ murein hydrolase activator NlpD
MIAVALTACGVEIYGKADGYDQYSDHALAITMPPNANFISQNFQPSTEQGKAGHIGMDVWGAVGTPVLAAASGTVIESFYEPLYGNQVVIDHGRSADGDRVLTEYKHLKNHMVAEGDRVTRGQQIGGMGATGALGMMVHLHFEVHKGENTGKAKPYDPHLFWTGGIGKVTCFDPEARYADSAFRTTYPVRCKPV